MTNVKQKKKSKIYLIRVEKKKVEELESFLRARDIEISKGFAFNLLVNNFIEHHKDKPIILGKPL